MPMSARHTYNWFHGTRFFCSATISSTPATATAAAPRLQFSAGSVMPSTPAMIEATRLGTSHPVGLALPTSRHRDRRHSNSSPVSGTTTR